RGRARRRPAAAGALLHGVPRPVPALLRLGDPRAARARPRGPPRLRARAGGAAPARAGLAAAHGEAPGLPVEPLGGLAPRPVVPRRPPGPRRARLRLLPPARRGARPVPAPAGAAPRAAHVQGDPARPGDDLGPCAPRVVEDPRRLRPRGP